MTSQAFGGRKSLRLPADASIARGGFGHTPIVRKKVNIAVSSFGLALHVWGARVYNQGEACGLSLFLFAVFGIILRLVADCNGEAPKKLFGGSAI